MKIFPLRCSVNKTFNLPFHNPKPKFFALHPCLSNCVLKQTHQEESFYRKHEAYKKKKSTLIYNFI